VNEPRIDAHIAERMLRGEPAGPPEVAELLAAASSGLTAEDLSGEDAAVAAFRSARSPHPRQARHLRISALVSLKAALIGLLLVLAGGVAVASQHLPGPLGTKPSHDTRTPTTSRTGVTRLSPTRATPRPVPGPHDKHPGHPPKKPHPAKPAKPAKKPKNKPHKVKPAGPPAGGV
jgi:hypothetical protein